MSENAWWSVPAIDMPGYAAVGVRARAHVIDPRSTAALFVPFESLGSNCEFGTVQREAGFNAPGLFRNVGFVEFGAIVTALESGVDGLFDDGSYGFELPDRWPDWRIDCPRHGFGFHSGIPSDVGAGSDTWDERTGKAVAALRFMRRKLCRDLVEAEKTFVFRFWRNLDDSEISRLHAAIRRHGPGWLLYVREDASRPVGWVEPRGDGLLVGAIARLSNQDPPCIDHAAWAAVARTAARLRAES